jgi:large subunit ribosomal protein L18
VDVRARVAKRRKVRAFRVRARVRGTPDRPRITVLRTNKHLWLQLIDDEAGRTLCSSSTKTLEIAKGGNVAAAKAVGTDLAKKAAALGVQAARLDRGPYRYHGRVKAVADAVRASGLKI